MLFNSIEFGIFLPLVFIIYWFLVNKNLKLQNLYLLVVSYIFYGWWDWRFLSLIIFSSFTDYFLGLALFKNTNIRKRKIFLFMSLAVNLGLLGFFKYYNFFIDSFVESFAELGVNLSYHSLRIILPVGISFYTFQTLSYTIDIYRKNIKPTKDIVAFFAFVGFFPQLVAGPIERAKNLIPQFTAPRKFDYHKAKDGLKQILWGLFKKVMIADNIGPYVDDIFAHSDVYSGSTLLLGIIYFAFQIYCDFSGYSDIAIGAAKLFGFDLMRNFAYPYFSRDIGEFWRRWHISLSTWFRDYLYIPLGGSRVGTWKKIRNIIIIFTISGFWHGANWTFIAWGFLNGLYFIPLMLMGKNRLNTGITSEGKLIPGIKVISQMGITFILTLFAWIFFRAETISHAFQYIGGMFSESLFVTPENFKNYYYLPLILVVIEWIYRDKEHPLKDLKFPVWIRWPVYYVLIYCILNMGGSQESFIYFQF